MPTIGVIVLVLLILWLVAIMVRQQYRNTISGWDGWDDD